MTLNWCFLFCFFIYLLIYFSLFSKFPIVSAVQLDSKQEYFQPEINLNLRQSSNFVSNTKSQQEGSCHWTWTQLLAEIENTVSIIRLRTDLKSRQLDDMMLAQWHFVIWNRQSHQSAQLRQWWHFSCDLNSFNFNNQFWVFCPIVHWWHLIVLH